MARIDYLSDEDGDLLIQGGDLVKGESDFDHISKIITSKPGDLRQYPEVGFNANRFKNAQASRKSEFERDLRDQLEADGYRGVRIDLSQQYWWKEFSVDTK